MKTTITLKGKEINKKFHTEKSIEIDFGGYEKFDMYDYPRLPKPFNITVHEKIDKNFINKNLNVQIKNKKVTYEGIGYISSIEHDKFIITGGNHQVIKRIL